jgi:predicted AAA+ superfamily ATPase
MRRFYTDILQTELLTQRQMLFVSGPRQVGKTTLAKAIVEQQHGQYYNWDNRQHRQWILESVNNATDAELLNQIGVHELRTQRAVVAFDELHKYKDWKNYLKGLFDLYEQQLAVLATGSARMDIFRKGGDSLMGRYFHYRMHPLSLREISAPHTAGQLLQDPQHPDGEALAQLLRFGGFPEPFLKADTRFYNRWQQLRQQQLVFEDIRDTNTVQDIAHLDVLASLLREQSGQVVRYSTLANQINVSVDTIRRWVTLLESFYYAFRVRPWFQNLASALRKEPKIYLWDWSQIKDVGARNENLIASHLLKAVHWWTDHGLGDYQLHYLRTKDQKEVDFLISRDNQPWLLVEVKSSAKQPLNKHLGWFQEQLGAEHALQVVMDMPYVEADCFAQGRPMKIPVETLLMRLA